MTTSLYTVVVCVFSLALLSQAFLVCAVAEPSNVAAIPVGGGGQNGADAPVDSVIRDFLASQDEGLTDMGKFHVHGWRWHTLSLVRETKRLQKLAERYQIRLSSDEEDASTSGATTNKKDAPHPLKQAADYVVGFNLKGLHRIEADCFFPWMREKISSLTDGNDVSKAFSTAMDQLEENRKSVAKLGKSIVSSIGAKC
jgi:hypothetical protein